MKLHILSDLHLEFGAMPRNYAPPPCDVVILAGDIGTGRSGMAWAMTTFPPDLPVIYVCGNHELYGRSFALYQELKAKADATPNIKFLECESVEINGVLFIGATLWTDFCLYDDPVKAAIEAKFGMNDFRLIEGMSVDLWTSRNRFGREAIERALERHAGKPRVVVTHHGPSPGSIPTRFAGDAMNAAYVSRILQEMPEHLWPQLWAHGHTHDSFDYLANITTRVVCNPRGYVGHELNPDFKIDFVVDLGARELSEGEE